MSEKGGLARDFLTEPEPHDSEILSHLRERWQPVILDVAAGLRGPAEAGPVQTGQKAYWHRRESLDEVRQELHPVLVAKMNPFEALLHAGWKDWRAFRKLSARDYHALAAMFHAAGMLFWQNEIKSCQEGEEWQRGYIPYFKAKQRRNEIRSSYHYAVYADNGHCDQQILAELKASDQELKILITQTEAAAKQTESNAPSPPAIRNLCFTYWDLGLDAEYPPLQPSAFWS